MRLADLPASISPAQAHDAAWLRRELGGKRTKDLRPAPEPDPETASPLDRADAMLLRLTALTNEVYALRQTLQAAER